MGAHYSELWIRARDERALEALQDDYDLEAVGSFQRVSQDEFPGHLLAPERSLDLGAREPSRHGEAVFLAMYDGPAGEICGSWLYEHARDGAVVRALAHIPVGADFKQLWARVEGEPEAWEAPFIAEGLDACVRGWLERRSWEEPPLPAPAPEELARLRAGWTRFHAGEEQPWGLAWEYTLCGLIRREVLGVG
ncbi:MAG: hypothetical protein AB7N76_13450 [Planctomycetota bacterium]